MKILMLCILLLCLTGCRSVGIKRGETKVVPPINSESPSKLDERKEKKIIEVPSGSTYTKETIAPTATEPAKTIERITYTEPAKIVEDIVHTQAVVAQPAKPDVRVQMQKENNAERRVLLYIALGAVAIAGVLFYLGQVGPAIVSAIAGGASFLLWYLAGNEDLMNYVLGIIGLAFLWWLYSRDKDARELKKKHELAEQSLIRSVQTVEELKIDKPSIANEIKEYNDANMDQSHKDYIKVLKNKIDRKYISERISASTQSSHAGTP
jgi:hypothetical protein